MRHVLCCVTILFSSSCFLMRSWIKFLGKVSKLRGRFSWALSHISPIGYSFKMLMEHFTIVLGVLKDTPFHYLIVIFTSSDYVRNCPIHLQMIYMFFWLSVLVNITFLLNYGSETLSNGHSNALHILLCQCSSTDEYMKGFSSIKVTLNAYSVVSKLMWR